MCYRNYLNFLLPTRYELILRHVYLSNCFCDQRTILYYLKCIEELTISGASHNTHGGDILNAIRLRDKTKFYERIRPPISVPVIYSY